MYTMKDAQRILGLSRDQLRDRLGHLEPICAPDLSRGPRNAVLVGEKTIVFLRRMLELERDDLGPQVAAAQVIEEIEESRNRPTGKDPRSTTGDPQIVSAGPWEIVIAEKNERILELKERIAFLEQRIERLEPLALPRPRRWVSIFRR